MVCASKVLIWKQSHVCAMQVYGLMERGAAQRATGATKLNEMSSRSHAVFMIIVEKSTVMAEDTMAAEDEEMEQFRGLAPGQAFTAILIPIFTIDVRYYQHGSARQASDIEKTLLPKSASPATKGQHRARPPFQQSLKAQMPSSIAALQLARQIVA